MIATDARIVTPSSIKLASVLAVLLLAAPLAIEAQPAKQIPRIGLLASSSTERDKSRLAAFRQGLRELGYLEGQNIVIEQRYAAGKFEDLPKLAAELVRLNLDVLVTEGTPAARAAKSATSTIPVVMGNAGDPVGTGLVAGLARPGGNITELSDFSFDLVTKRLELLKEMVPSASHVAVLLNPANPTNPLELRKLQAAAPALRVTLFPFEVSGADDIERA
jgi:putative ABC transport system substrate-binding protein